MREPKHNSLRSCKSLRPEIERIARDLPGISSEKDDHLYRHVDLCLHCGNAYSALRSIAMEEAAKKAMAEGDEWTLKALILAGQGYSINTSMLTPPTWSKAKIREIVKLKDLWSKSLSEGIELRMIIGLKDYDPRKRALDKMEKRLDQLRAEVDRHQKEARKALK